MVAVDYWPQEEGYIVEGSPVMMCVSASTIGENSSVYLSASTAGQVTVAASIAWGDSIGVALRAVTVTGQMVPVAFAGIVKMIGNCTLALGDNVCSNGDDTAKVIDVPTSLNIMNGSDVGTAYILGTALHAAVGDNLGDEILVLIGRR